MSLFQQLNVKHSCFPCKAVCQPVSCEAEERVIADICSPNISCKAKVGHTVNLSLHFSLKFREDTGDDTFSEKTSTWQGVSQFQLLDELSKTFILDHRERLGIQSDERSSHQFFCVCAWREHR